MANSENNSGPATPKQVNVVTGVQRLTLGHVRSVFRLLADVRDAGSSPIAWRRRLVAGLLRLVGGSTGIAAEAIIPKKVGRPRLVGTVIGGVTDPRLVAIYRALVERGPYAIDLRHEGLSEPTNGTFMRTRQQMADSRAWRNRPDLDPWRTLDCEYFICSNRYLPSFGCVHLIILTRSSRDGPFAELERRLVALFHEELGRLWRKDDDDPTAELPPYLQQTLDLLLEGASEGQIVARLGLSPHTVHDHVKRLYRRFHVNSRAQLLVHLSHAPLMRAPRLCVSLLNSEDSQTFDSVETVEVEPGRDSPAVHTLQRSFRTAHA